MTADPHPALISDTTSTTENLWVYRNVAYISVDFLTMCDLVRISSSYNTIAIMPQSHCPESTPERA